MPNWLIISRIPWGEAGGNSGEAESGYNHWGGEPGALVLTSPQVSVGPEGLKLFRDHWSIENSQHHVKDRSWDEDIHRPGLGEAFATLVNRH